MFENVGFIKANVPFVREYDSEKSPCVMFRRKFTAGKFQKATIYVCGLGYGYYYLNGKKITEDLFTAPVSDYNRTLWYNKYDVTSLLENGENIFTVICGNGFYNESFETEWQHSKVAWRDNPKFILQLEADDEIILTSDEEWKYTTHTPFVFNHLRSGEHFDSRLYDPKFNQFEFDDSSWEYAINDLTPPKGIFRECMCEPIRECDEYETISITKTGDRRYVFDIGQVISGYVRLKIKQKSGDKIIIRYGEELEPDNSIKGNGMPECYPESEFMTDKFICNGEEFTWSPMFTYHGFRYVELTGIDNPQFDTVKGIFVHQDVKLISGFECSDETLNKLYEMGKMATWSNLFYMPTDCPTREKLGWANDAQASAEQMLTNFDISGLFKKWMVDVTDVMREDGSMSGIIPSSGWGYDWGNGPASDGVLFEIPYKVYLYTGDKTLLTDNLPYFKRYIDYLKTKRDENKLMDFGLWDFMPAKPTGTPVTFTNEVLLVKFLKIAKLAASFAGDKNLESQFSVELEEIISIINDKFINPDGTCNINEQTAVAMLIYHKVYTDIEPLKNQLKALVEEKDFHLDCGMVGLRHLYIALNDCGLAEYAYRILKSEGYPSYTDWIKKGATALCETWHPWASQNHHMYSDIMSWMMKTLAGINICEDAPAYEKVIIKPEFLQGIDYCRGYTQTSFGEIAVNWKRNDGKIILEVKVPDKVSAIYNGEVLKTGKNIICIEA